MNKEQRDKAEVFSETTTFNGAGLSPHEKDLVEHGFDAGHASRQSEIDELRSQAKALFNALNTAHCFVDKRENPRAEKLCVDALKSYELFRDEPLTKHKGGV